MQVRRTPSLDQIRHHLRCSLLLLLAPLALQACGGDSASDTQSADAMGGAGSGKMSFEGYTTDTSSKSRRTRTRNKPPVISGSPTTQTLAGLAYVFAPSASDVDGDRLTFAIANMPAWASFSTSTGLLSGTPTTAQVGRTAGIQISVSDGRATVALPAFDLEVVNTTTSPPTPVANNATVSWVAPTTNADGTPLSDLAGYKLYYGQNAGALDRVVNVIGASTTSQVVQNLGSGQWFFAVAALNSSGLESALSALASRSYP
jgi:hypothetical protein